MNITIYGRQGCGICDRFKQHVKDFGFEYEFADFDEYTDWEKGIWRDRDVCRVLAAYRFINDEHLPVINIDNQFYSYAQAMSILKKEKEKNEKVLSVQK